MPTEAREHDFVAVGPTRRLRFNDVGESVDRVSERSECDADGQHRRGCSLASLHPLMTSHKPIKTVRLGADLITRPSSSSRSSLIGFRQNGDEGLPAHG
jgi:hypothetical protein